MKQNDIISMYNPRLGEGARFNRDRLKNLLREAIDETNFDYEELLLHITRKDMVENIIDRLWEELK